MVSPVSLPTLLSQPLVAFTIELDNEFEHQMAQRYARRGPWLTSMAMWSNFVQFVPPDGIALRDLEPCARITNLNGLVRWRYVTVEPDPADTRAKPPRSEWVVRPTGAGRHAQEVWRPLAGAIEQRWRARFGGDAIDALRESLAAIAGRLDLALPPFLPVVAHDMFTRLPPVGRWPDPIAGDGDSVPDLSVLLARVLLALTIAVERDSEVSLPMGANVVRVLAERGVRVRDLPRLSGVSKEAISMIAGFLERRGFVSIERDPGEPRTKLARLTPKGLRAQANGGQRVDTVETQWRTQFGDDAVDALRGALEPLVGDATAATSPLFGGLEPYAEGWRASVPAPATLPHYPMVLHRGGYPDGS